MTRRTPSSTCLGATVLILLAGCVGDVTTGSTARVKGPLFVDEAFRFDGLAEMVATSHLIVEATVVDVEAGRIVGGFVPPEAELEGAEGDGAFQYTRVTLRVDDVLVGRVDGSLLTIEELPSVQIPVSEIGVHGVYFLWTSPEDPHPFIINSQGRYVATEDGHLDAPYTQAVVNMVQTSSGAWIPEPSEAWVHEIESETLADLKDAVRRTRETVSAELIPPQQPGARALGSAQR